MKLETFFEKFDQFADAPNAVARMRGLVLHLAFSGKLLPTSESWPLTPLKSLATKIGSGATPAGGRESYFTEGIPLIRSMNVHFAGFEPKGLVFLSDEQAKQLANVTVQSADVLLNITGASIGRVTTAPSEMAGARVNQHVAIIRPIKELDAQFLAKFLASPAIQRMIDDVQVGATREALTKGMIEQFDIPLPPIAEQKRIVAKVDELMALCDRLEAQQQERETRHAALARASLARFADAPTPANLQFLFHPSYAIPPADLRKSILTLAVQGKLVPQDPNDEPAEELLECVKAARAALVVERKVRQSDEVEYSLQDEADDAPPGWVAVHVNDVAIVQGGKRLPNGAVFSESPTPHVYIRVTDMKNGTISETGLRYISPEVQREIARYIINKEDLYITIAGTIGDVGCVPESLDGHNLTENAAKIVFRAFDRRFFQLALSSDFVQAQFLEKTKQMAQPKLALKRIAGAKFYLPPLAEQRRIVAKVEQLMALVDALETQLAASRATAANLLSALVAELTAM